MASVAPASERRMSIGRVFSRAFGAIGAHPGAMFGIAFLFGAVPSLLINLFMQYNGVATAPNLAYLWIGVLLLKIAFTMLAQGALVRATIAYSDGQTVGFGASALAGLRKIVPLFVLAILIVLGVGFASLLLLVPGIILYVVWSIAAPVLVAENRGIVGALRRSAELTRGARWNVFAILLVSLLFYYLVAAISGIVMVAVFGGVQAMVAQQAQGASTIVILVGSVFTTLSTTVAASIQTALYVELRDWKDGPAADTLGEIFA